ncbi:carbonate dehydratase [Geobacter sp. SVR]|uniref:carbonate dehydratase n=1 Tax=Geobacter sp. SVR TaxID=2495594 RepID=UPI00143EF6B6|nr:carbonate dehydratase [Geobacter sp. SVR]BCS55320.1 carbonic anhydrase [Geobacter sp. SVR]GCF87245.1 carbonic anhydrase [Geobacter sp. SVR]
MLKRNLSDLLESNRDWSIRMTGQDASFFQRLVNQHAPEYLWIGCSDSRVPANEIVGLLPGELFVHRNVANVVIHTDLNCLSVIQYAVEVLKVRHIIVCGHYGCGGIEAALENRKLGLIDNWLRHVQDVQQKHQRRLLPQESSKSVSDRLCELHVIEQVVNVCKTTIVREAWERGQNLVIHGWIYSLKNGLVTDLGISVADAGELDQIYDAALSGLNNCGCCA